MGSIVNERARSIYKANMGTVFMIGMVYSLINGVMTNITDSVDFFLLTALVSILRSMVSASSACFFFRTYNRGTADTQDCTSIFSGYGDISKVMAIALVHTAINFAMALLAKLFSDMLMFSFVLSMTSSFISMLFVAVWYLYIANPDYNTADYFKASAKYIGDNLFGYIGFVFMHFVVIFAAIFLGILLAFTFIGILLAVVFVLVYVPYVELAVAGYVSRLIPDEWYTGAAQF